MTKHGIDTRRIERTTSSLRTMRSSIFLRSQSITYNQCWYITGIGITSARCSPTPIRKTPKVQIPREIRTGEIRGAPPLAQIDLLITSGLAFSDLAVESDGNFASTG